MPKKIYNWTSDTPDWLSKEQRANLCTTKHKKTKTAYKQSLEGKVDISELYGIDFINQIKKKFFEIHIRGWEWGGIPHLVVEATKGNQLFFPYISG